MIIAKYIAIWRHLFSWNVARNICFTYSIYKNASTQSMVPASITHAHDVRTPNDKMYHEHDFRSYIHWNHNVILTKIWQITRCSYHSEAIKIYRIIVVWFSQISMKQNSTHTQYGLYIIKTYSPSVFHYFLNIHHSRHPSIFVKNLRLVLEDPQMEYINSVHLTWSIRSDFRLKEFV